MNYHDAEALYQVLLEQLRSAYATPDATPSTTAFGAQAGASAVLLVGIHSGGAWLAERLAHDLGAAAFGVVNVALHRDDYAKKGLHIQAGPTSLPFEVEQRRILLIDDVLHTGRTIRAAINELYDYGRPATIDLAVLVDRGGRELPIAAQFIGATLTVPAGQTLVLSRAAAAEQTQPAWSLHLEAATG